MVKFPHSIKLCLALVSATQSLCLSDRNPIPWLLTQDIIITSRSWPWKPSTVFTSKVIFFFKLSGKGDILKKNAYISPRVQLGWTMKKKKKKRLVDPATHFSLILFSTSVLWIL